ncbi:MAG: hypothetical protein WC626_12825 [Methanoregula sp.]
MHTTQYIQPENTTMTEPEPAEEQEVCLKEGDEYLVGGIELHALIVEEGGRPGVEFICEPVVHDREIPEGVAEYNQAIEEMCRATVTNFPNPQSLGRFYREVKKDGLKNRCWYRVIVTARVGAGDKITGRVTDVIDPALVRADPHVRFRARQLRAMLQRSLAEE